jgi:hypothetical protein
MVIYHYFIELPYRLRQAPILRYYGQREWKNVTYDLVFASWGEEAAHAEHDQYILYINPATKLVDYSIYTIRDNTSPFTRQKYGSIAFQEYKNIDGFQLPTKLPVLLDDGVVRKQSLDRSIVQTSSRTNYHSNTTQRQKRHCLTTTSTESYPTKLPDWY